MPCFAVGEKTASVAQSLGYSAIAMGGDAEGLIAELTKLGPAAPLFLIPTTCEPWQFRADRTIDPSPSGWRFLFTHTT